MIMKNTPNSTRAGRRIIAALQEILDAQASGKPFAGMKVTVRDVTVDQPSTYDARAVQATRDKLGVSQSVFAQLMGVSVMLAQSWEQGKRFPDGVARRLLDQINRDPRHFVGYIRKAS
jgi:putative transcriptional regulator